MPVSLRQLEKLNSCMQSMEALMAEDSIAKKDASEIYATIQDMLPGQPNPINLDRENISTSELLEDFFELQKNYYHALVYSLDQQGRYDLLDRFKSLPYSPIRQLVTTHVIATINDIGGFEIDASEVELDPAALNGDVESDYLDNPLDLQYAISKHLKKMLSDRSMSDGFDDASDDDDSVDKSQISLQAAAILAANKPVRMPKILRKLDAKTVDVTLSHIEEHARYYAEILNDPEFIASADNYRGQIFSTDMNSVIMFIGDDIGRKHRKMVVSLRELLIRLKQEEPNLFKELYKEFSKIFMRDLNDQLGKSVAHKSKKITPAYLTMQTQTKHSNRINDATYARKRIRELLLQGRAGRGLLLRLYTQREMQARAANDFTDWRLARAASLRSAADASTFLRDNFFAKVTNDIDNNFLQNAFAIISNYQLLTGQDMIAMLDRGLLILEERFNTTRKEIIEVIWQELFRIYDFDMAKYQALPSDDLFKLELNNMYFKLAERYIVGQVAALYFQYYSNYITSLDSQKPETLQWLKDFKENILVSGRADQEYFKTIISMCNKKISQIETANSGAFSRLIAPSAKLNTLDIQQRIKQSLDSADCNGLLQILSEIADLLTERRAKFDNVGATLLQLQTLYRTTFIQWLNLANATEFAPYNITAASKEPDGINTLEKMMNIDIYYLDEASKVADLMIEYQKIAGTFGDAYDQMDRDQMQIFGNYVTMVCNLIAKEDTDIQEVVRYIEPLAKGVTIANRIEKAKYSREKRFEGSDSNEAIPILLNPLNFIQQVNQLLLIYIKLYQISDLDSLPDKRNELGEYTKQDAINDLKLLRQMGQHIPAMCKFVNDLSVSEKVSGAAPRIVSRPT